MAQRRPAELPPAAATAVDAADAPAGPAALPSAAVDTALDQALHAAPRAAYSARQWQLMIVALLLACLAQAWLARTLARAPYVDVSWRASTAHDLQLFASGRDALQGLRGATLSAIVGSRGERLRAADMSLLRSPRWSVDGAERERMLATQDRLSRMVNAGPLWLRFDDGRELLVQPAPRGVAGLGALFWLLCAVSLLLLMAGVVVVLARRRLRNWLYLTMCYSQAINLMIMAVEGLPGMGLPPGFSGHALWARGGCDLLTLAAAVHIATLHPLRLPAGPAIASAAWLAAAALLAAIGTESLHPVWWAMQATMLGGGGLVIALLAWSYRIEPNPLSLLMRHFTALAVATLALLSLAVALASRQGSLSGSMAAISSVIWYLFLASLLLQLPFISRMPRLAREFAMLAGISTVATSLDLLLESLFALEPLAALALSVFIALALYMATRHWLFHQISGSSALSAERLFERLYRMVRELETRPQDSAELLSRLLREIFEPMELRRVARRALRSRVLGDGSIMVVPLPHIDPGGDVANAVPDASLLLRFAGRGKRIFTRDDARLTDRVVEQLQRAVAYDKAVERGRNEERTRIAQDLHDDIGARLLTLMYKSQTAEIEDYIRHTLKDLKTLTRGLAAGDHRLSHATAEWKTDIGQRLTAAQIELSWSFTHDRDVVLSVVQWSALTRVLRELVSNTIQHSCATHVDVTATLEQGSLRLSVGDDGIGRDPQAWSHGLGLGGVRKRVKLLGGSVHWRENGSAGIVCVVVLPDMTAPT
jgi:signal transduction histidine kinase